MKNFKMILLVVAATITNINGFVFSQSNAPSGLPNTLNERDFFNVNIKNKYPENEWKDLKVEGANANGKKAKPNDGKDDTHVLQRIINNLSKTDGGVIEIPAGTWHLMFVNLKSNVHLVINSNAIIKPSPNSNEKIIFRLGTEGFMSKNVSIRSNNGKKFTVDISEVPSLRKFTVVGVKSAKHFLISDFKVLDNWSYVSALDFAAAKLNGSWKVPTKGLIKNIDINKAHGSYGLVQVRSGKNLLFKKISGKGGVTLRIETDDYKVKNGNIPQSIAKVSEISAYDVSCVDGSTAVMLQPWGAKNGWVDIQKIYSKSCVATVRIDRPQVNNKSKGIGYFNRNSRITDVKSVYGTQAMVKKGIDQWVPCSVRNNPQIFKTPKIWPQAIPFRRGPSVAPILYRASDTKKPNNSKNYKIKIPSYNKLKAKASGYPSSFIMIARNNHSINCVNCNANGRNTGDSCNDGDPCTTNDKITTNCYCAGTNTCKTGNLNESYNRDFTDENNFIFVYGKPLDKELNTLVLDYTTNQSDNSNSKVSIFDISGKEVYSKTINTLKGFNKILLDDVGNLEAGMFTIRVINQEIITTAKIIVN